jgi:CBS domain-containing protein
MATHARDTAGWFFLGSVAESVLRESRLPLLLVRPDEAAVEMIGAAAERYRVEPPAPPALWRQPISELMPPNPVVVREDTPLEEVARATLDHRIGAIPVVDGRGQLVGIVTTSDLTGHDPWTPLSGYQVVQCIQPSTDGEVFDQVWAAGRSMTASEIMSRPVVARQDESASEVARRMLSRDLNHIPVVHDGLPVGLVARLDLLKLLLSD